MRLEEYDVVVVGAGTAGVETARLLAGAGASVTLLCPGESDLVTEEPLVGSGVDVRLGAIVTAIHRDGTVELTWRRRTSTIAADLVVVDAAQGQSGRVIAGALVEALERDAADPSASRRGYV